MKNTVLLYTDLLPLIEYLPNEDVGILFKALMIYATEGEYDGFDDLPNNVKGIFKQAKAKLDENNEKYKEKVERLNQNRRSSSNEKQDTKDEQQISDRNHTDINMKSDRNHTDITQISDRYHTDIISDTDTVTVTDTVYKEKDKSKDLSKKKKFTPPTLEELEQYCEERNNTIDPIKFHDFYESKGWFVGKNKMKDWKAAVRNWERNEKNKASPNLVSTTKQEDIPILRGVTVL